MPRKTLKHKKRSRASRKIQHGGKFESARRRINREMTRASDKFNAVEITSDHPDYIKYKFTEKAPPNREFIVELGELYPFRAPLITINGKLINIHRLGRNMPYYPNILIADEINHYITSPKKPNKALILCHPEVDTGSFSPLKLDNHYLGSINDSGKSSFEQIFSKYGLSGEVDFETVDIRFGGDYVADAFSDAFIESHTNEYDMVLVPDCDGEFFKLQQRERVNKPYIKGVQLLTTEIKPIEVYNEDITKFITLSLKLCQMVKKGGLVYFSKLLDESTAEKLVTALNEYGFETEFVQDTPLYLGSWFGNRRYIVAKKL